jgi:CO/xanthine dehydrogenase FAD-binding subunit
VARILRRGLGWADRTIRSTAAAGRTMDLNTIVSVRRPRHRADLAEYGSGDAWLAGGTYLFSEPQPRLRRLFDLADLAWEPLVVSEQGLSIAATCKVATLDAFEPPLDWSAAALIGQCCRAFLASFKIWNMATVGGNVCLALPAGPMISLTAGLEGICVIWTRDGGERRMPAADFVLGPQSNALRPGEVLRSIELPAPALRKRVAFRRASLTSLGRSGVLLIGARSSSGGLTLSVTASTRRPVQIALAEMPDQPALREALAEAIPFSLYHDDMHGRPDWRRHMTFEFAEEIRQELAGGRP